jgi:hypothetical protein
MQDPTTALFGQPQFHYPALLSTPPNPQRHTPLATPPSTTRSCVVCSRKKVKCDKLHPCGHCRKSRSQCVFPGPRKSGKNAKATEKQLRLRLNHLEKLVHQMHDPSNPSGDNGQYQDEGSRRTRALVSYRRPLGQENGRLLLSRGASRYVSCGFWAALSDNVSGLDISKAPNQVVHFTH